MNKTSFPSFVARAAFFAALTLPSVNAFSQGTPGSSARYIPNEIEKQDARVFQIIKKAEDHFKNGKLNLDDNKRDQARDEFDKAVDVVLESGMDVRANQRLQTYYLELVERIYREEVPAQGLNNALVAQSTVQQGAQDTKPAAPVVGFRDQKFEPSPLDDLAKLVLTEKEQEVNANDLNALEAAKNSINFGFTVNPLIQQYINYYQGRGRRTMEVGISRSGRYMSLARKIFKQEGVPEDITWLAQVESSWIPRAYSSAAASGLWQFVPSTGARFGLRQTAWVDERNSFEAATRASAKYIRWLSDRYNGNWELAMAAYNTGEGNVDRAIARAGQANFWAIYPYIAQETRNYVPNILATILIAKEPGKFGFAGIKPEPPAAYDVVQVPTATSLQLIADAVDTNVDYLRSLNPELRRDITPRGEAYQVRLPAGKARQFVAVLKRIPGDRRESARVISVAPGEGLQEIANRTGVSLALLQQMNNGVDAKTLGGKVVVPKLIQTTSYVRAKSPGAAAEAGNGGLGRMTARRGDTIAKIAQRANASVDDVARLNGMSPNAELNPGQEVKIPSAAPAPSRRRGR
ncbi:MAG: rane-bound lytic murein transglycosylase [Blastocatellia bacterium]|nr:rane-bound lytic murein transglycosylase [Blastocatellia bacterium]